MLTIRLYHGHVTRSSIHREILTALSSGVTHLDDLLDHCLTHTDLAKWAEDEDVSPEEYLLFEIDESGRFFITDDDKLVRLDELADGLIFTHRLTEIEVARDLVEMNPDLAALDLGAPQLSSPAGPVTLEFDFTGDFPFEHGGWVGPPGWLSGFDPGDLVAFRRVGDEVEVESAGTVGDGAAEVSAIRLVFDEEIGLEEGVGEEPWQILQDAIVVDDALFRRPVRPVSELLADAGLSSRGAFIGSRDTPWEPPGVVATQRFRDTLSQRYGLEGCCDDALDVVIDAWHSHVSGNHHPAARSVNRALAHGAVVEAFCDWLQHYFGIDSARIEEFAGRLVSPDRRHAGAARLVLARHYEAVGDVLTAEEQLEDAVQTDPDFGPALAELSWYASDRGDADRVVSLRRRAGFGDDDEWLSLHASVGTSVPEVGRNEPCPCGSGRKYKQCHLGKTEISPRELVTWLIGKLTVFITRPERESRLLGLAASAMWEDFEVPDLARMKRDEFIVELAVFEDGGVSEFLDRRGPLLPEDEHDILERWEDAPLRLWEVISNDGVSALIFRDTGSGDTREVTDRSAAAKFQGGDQVLARLLPAWGETWLSSVLVPIAPQHRDSLLRVLDEYHDADTLAMWYGGLHAPPRMANREGEPLVLCQVRLKPTTTWDELEAVLDEHYVKDEDDEVWTEYLPLDDDERLIRAIIRQRDNEVEVEVNSEARMERVLTTLNDVAEVVSQTVRPATTLKEINDLQETMGDSPEPAEPDPPVPPEVLEEMRDRLERRWLDEEVPALGGVTPRQAAADPTRCEDLIALLRTFDRMPVNHELAMRPDVLRQALGLTD